MNFYKIGKIGYWLGVVYIPANKQKDLYRAISVGLIFWVWEIRL